MPRRVLLAELTKNYNAIKDCMKKIVIQREEMFALGKKVDYIQVVLLLQQESGLHTSRIAVTARKWTTYKSYCCYSKKVDYIQVVLLLQQESGLHKSRIAVTARKWTTYKSYCCYSKKVDYIQVVLLLQQESGIHKSRIAVTEYAVKLDWK
ncbi:hypothetical protein DPMN_173061 [Dreissena polymorpha]|uniref:Uncharacterized protein n=1 Tax=Dreissena polymorpha TaxID=45954 RepID=A0A9D4E2Q4_DREPO|nr:hypothetical protein DPMN_173061 [Dreissena polymorpha]